MNKSVSILSASPRKNGNSDLLCREFERGARDGGHETEYIFLKDQDIRYCQGCGACSEKGLPCPQKDDMPRILDRMAEADVIVMATPVYFYTMNAQMKTLIDRTCSRYTVLSGKEFYFIVTAADDSIPAMERTIEGFRGFTSCLDNPVEKGILYGTGVWKTGEISNTKTMAQAYDMGRSV